MRCFVAIDLPSEAREELARIQKQLPEEKMKLVEKENLHLTLAFLGELSDFEINKCKELLKQIKFEQFEAKLGNIGVFPNEKFIRVVWISLEPENLLRELHDMIYTKLSKKFKIDERFESHITLARVKHISKKEEFIKKLKEIKIKSIKFKIDFFSLKKSMLTKKGPIYENIIEFKLF